MNDHWGVLGLEPTGDVLAIKKAYAGLLKKNRPDDAPAAYQALRQAYEWALAEAAWLSRAPDDADERASSDEPADLMRDDEGTPPAPLLVSAADVHAPGDRVVVDDHGEAIDLAYERAEALLERWAGRLAHCEVDDAEACWKDLRRDLEALPLDEQGDASAVFADFVLEREALPTMLLASMARHFRWGRDYRDAERLGPMRLAQLRDRLNQDAPTLFRDARQVEQASELLRLDWVLQHQGKLFGWLYAALAGPHLQRMMLETDDRQRRALEISFLRWEAVRVATARAGLIRLLFVLACVVPAAYVLAQPAQGIDWMLGAAFFAGAYWFTAWGLGRSMPMAGVELDSALARLNALASGQSRIVAAVAIPIVVALVARDEVALPALQSVFSDEMLTVAAILLCIAALLIPPERTEERQIALPMLGALSFGLTSLTGDEGAGWVVAMGAAAAWIGLGGWVYQRYHDQIMAYYRDPWSFLRPRAWWGWLLLVVAFKFVIAALVLVLTLALPVTLRVLARYLSAQTVWLAIGLAVGLELAEADNAARLGLLALAIAAAVLTTLQALAEWVSPRLFSRVPATFFADEA